MIGWREGRASLYCVARSVLVFSRLRGKVEDEVADKVENEVEVELELGSVNWNGRNSHMGVFEEYSFEIAFSASILISYLES